MNPDSVNKISFATLADSLGTPSIMEHIGIPEFDPKNKLHQKLSEISQKCHELKSKSSADDAIQVVLVEKGIEKLEKENDELVMKLFSEKV